MNVAKGEAIEFVLSVISPYFSNEYFTRNETTRLREVKKNIF